MCEADILTQVTHQSVFGQEVDATEEDILARNLLLLLLLLPMGLLLLGIVQRGCEGEIAELRNVETAAAAQRVGDVITQGLEHSLDVGTA